MPTRAPHTCTHTLVPTQARPQAQTRMDTRAPRFTFGLDSSTNRRGRARGPMSVIHKWPHTCEPPHTRVPRAPADAHASPCTCVHMGPRVPWASPHLQGHPPSLRTCTRAAGQLGGGLCLAQTEGLHSVRRWGGAPRKVPLARPRGQRKWGLGARTRKPCTAAAQPTLRPGAAAPCSPAGGLGGCFWTGRGQLKGWKSEAPPRKPGSRPLRAGRGGDGSRAPTASRGSAPARSSTAPTVSALCASCHEARPGRSEGMCPPEPVHLQEAGFHVTITLKVPSSPHQQQRVAGFLCARDEGRCDKSPQAR